MYRIIEERLGKDGDNGKEGETERWGSARHTGQPSKLINLYYKRRKVQVPSAFHVPRSVCGDATAKL